MNADKARLAVDHDNLEANIHHGLIRSDAREIVDKLTAFGDVVQFTATA
jgi:hypothetical protein